MKNSKIVGYLYGSGIACVKELQLMNVLNREKAWTPELNAYDIEIYNDSNRDFEDLQGIAFFIEDKGVADAFLGFWAVYVQQCEKKGCKLKEMDAQTYKKIINYFMGSEKMGQMKQASESNYASFGDGEKGVWATYMEESEAFFKIECELADFEHATKRLLELERFNYFIEKLEQSQLSVK